MRDWRLARLAFPALAPFSRGLLKIHPPMRIGITHPWAKVLTGNWYRANGCQDSWPDDQVYYPGLPLVGPVA